VSAGRSGGAADDFFGRLNQRERDALVAVGRARRYERGRPIFHEGDTSNFVVVLERGRVKIVTTTATGSETLLSVRGTGSLVGEFAALDDSPRLATAVAIERVGALVVSADDFREFLARHPRAAVELVHTLVGRLRESDRRRVEFGAYDTTRRLAAVLVDLASHAATSESHDVEIRLAQHELAAMIGASRESVARGLAALRAEGLVRTGRGTIVLADVEALRAVV
jgi:CRP/FNR family transcriptional regulator, cyclic AMP receptor protein